MKSPYTHKNIYSNWNIVQHRISLGSIVGSLLFLSYVNNLPLNINSINTPVLFTDYTSVIVSGSNANWLTELSNYVFTGMNK
jgi:hypothetical protein